MVKIEYTKTNEGNHRLMLTARDEASREELDSIMQVLTLGKTKRTRYDTSSIGVIEYKSFPVPTAAEFEKPKT
jgi:hypothetical protein